MILELLKQLYFVLSYISSTNSFPKALTKEQEEAELEKYSRGDQNAKNKLIEHNLRLVAHVSRRYASAVADSDDLISIGTIGLIKGINSFKAEKGTRLSTYIARCIENEILMFIRASKKNKSEISIEEPIGIDKEGNQITLNDILSTDDDIIDTVEKNVRIDKLKNVMDCLDERESQIINLRYGLNGCTENTQKKVSKILGISRSYVSRIEKRAIEKLKKSFEQ